VGGTSAADLQAELGSDRNDAIYDTPDPQTREGSGKFRLNFKFRQKVEGVLSSFNLGAFGIRENSERLYFGDKVLTAGTDYTIDYDLGQVTLNDAASLFATDPSAQIRATWEQKSLPDRANQRVRP
jgi:cell surface protein SprA